ncbi:MAG: WbqC family protein [Bacteroidota bacterium]
MYPSSCLIECQCLPPVHVMSTLLRYDIVYWEAHENYQKRSYRSRCQITNAQGPETMVVPLRKGKNAQTPIQLVDISYSDDWTAHWNNQLHQAYRAAPYYIYYIDGLVGLLSRKYEKLWEFNSCLFQWLLDTIELPIEWQVTKTYERNPASQTDLRDLFRPSQVPQNASVLTYPQVYEDRHGFVPGLSTLDLLMCLGPEAKVYLTRLSEAIDDEQRRSQ